MSLAACSQGKAQIGVTKLERRALSKAKPQTDPNNPGPMLKDACVFVRKWMLPNSPCLLSARRDGPVRLCSAHSARQADDGRNWA